jgi:hypothetical protein
MSEIKVWSNCGAENRNTRRKPNLSNINPTSNVLGSNPGLCGERPETSRLTHAMVPILREI